MSVFNRSGLFPELRKPYIFAHQGGEHLAPTNTMAAFAVADAIGGIDFLDIDVHMTKDGHLVGIHDSTVDRTTNGQGRVDTYTLAELQQLDAGYWFRDLQGNYSYRGKGVRIPALEEVFHAYSDRYYLQFEIKDAYPKGQVSQIEEKLWKLIQQYHVEKKVIVGSFYDAIIKRFQHVTGGQVAVEGGRREVTRFVMAHSIWNVSGLYRPSSHALSLPISSNGINLKRRSLIERAHQRGLEIYYWTVNDVSTMEELLTMGVDGIFTNRPDLLKKVMQEMGLR